MSELKWTKVFETSQVHFAEILKGALEEEGIKVNLINKQDSAYVMLGHIELYVLDDDALRAAHLIKSNNLE